METLTFNEFPARKIIESGWYDESDKQLSFAYCDKTLNTEEGLRAFIALKQENAPIAIEGNGCKIMGYYIKKRDDRGRLFSDLYVLQDRLFEEAINSAIMWSDGNGVLSFQYYWFELSENTIQLSDFLENPQKKGTIVYSVIKK